jgi:serine O-acetyltransferase
VTDQERSRRIRALAARLAGTYREMGQINRIGEQNLPSRDMIVDLLDRLLVLVFPGYFGDRVPRETDMELWAGGQLDHLAVELADILEQTIRFCCQHPCSCSGLWATGADGDPAHDIPLVARDLTLKYLDHLPGVRVELRGDIHAAFAGDPAAVSTDEIILCYPGPFAIAVHRLAHPLYRMGVPLLPRIMSEWAHQRTGVDIHPGARIGQSFFIDHGTGVVIGETTVIGDRVKIYQGVTLGALSFPRNPDGSLVKSRRRHPTVGHDVTVYANATILGGQTIIGDGAVVGGGAWVTSSVDPGSVVFMGTMHAATPGSPDR